MSEQLLTFHTFPNEEIAADFVEKFKLSGIEYSLIKLPPAMLGTEIFGTSSTPEIQLKLRPGDFSRAQKFLEAYYDSQLDNIDKGHYLFSFSDAELFDIIRNPDEWGYLDYRLARKILTERGFSVDNTALDDLKSKRKELLAKPEKVNFLLYFFACLFILCGILYIISPLFAVYDFYFAFVLVSFFIGRHIASNKKLMPDGELVFSYADSDRQLGTLLKWVALVVFLICLIKFSLLSFDIMSRF
jgi:hypothetical protein